MSTATIEPPPPSPTLVLPARQPMLSPVSWRVLIIVVVAVLALVPICSMLVPDGSPFHLSAYALTLVGKIMCYSIGALALDLVWGYCGILSLGHSLFFALGGYMMGMYLMRSIGLEGVYHSHLPDFMVFLDWKALPWYWHGTEHFWYAALLVILVPGLLAWIFGFFAFRSRVKGVYLSIITQALTFAAMLLFYRNETGFGGNNGFTDFKRILGFPIAAVGTRTGLFMFTFATLVAGFLVLQIYRHVEIGPCGDGGSRHGIASDVSRLQSAWLQAVSSGPFQPSCAGSPVRCMCRKSELSTRAKCRRATPSRWRSGLRSAGAAL